LGFGVPPGRRKTVGVSGKRILVALAVAAVLGWLLVAAQASRGKDCHFNVHFAKRVVCTRR